MRAIAFEDDEPPPLPDTDGGAGARVGEGTGILGSLKETAVEDRAANPTDGGLARKTE